MTEFELNEPHSRCRGSSLVEVAMGIVILTTVIGGAMSLLVSASDSSAASNTRTSNLRMAIESVERMRAVFSKAKIENISADGDTLVYSLPVSPNGDGTIVDPATGEITWGIKDSNGERVGGTATLRFVRFDTLREAVVGRDVNMDGDLVDVFEQGYLENTTDMGLAIPVPKVQILLLQGNHAADMDGDGQPDPIFSIGAHGQLVIRHCLEDAKRGIRVTETNCNVIEKAAF